MSIRFENECLDCATESFPCVGSACSYRNVPHFYCDGCGEEFDSDELYDYEEEQMLCKDCLADKFETIAQVLDKHPEYYMTSEEGDY